MYGSFEQLNGRLSLILAVNAPANDTITATTRREGQEEPEGLVAAQEFYVTRNPLPLHADDQLVEEEEDTTTTRDHLDSARVYNHEKAAAEDPAAGTKPPPPASSFRAGGGSGGSFGELGMVTRSELTTKTLGGVWRRTRRRHRRHREGWNSQQRLEEEEQEHIRVRV